MRREERYSTAVECCPFIDVCACRETPGPRRGDEEMRDKFKSRLAVLHDRLYILVPELVRNAIVKDMGKEIKHLAGTPCEVEVEL